MVGEVCYPLIVSRHNGLELGSAMRTKAMGNALKCTPLGYLVMLISVAWPRHSVTGAMTHYWGFRELKLA